MASPSKTNPPSKRKRWTVQRKYDLVLESLRGKQSVAELCREHGITQSTFYEWRERFLEAARDSLSQRGLSARERELQQRIEDLERLLGQKTMETEILKKFADLREQRRGT